MGKQIREKKGRQIRYDKNEVEQKNFCLFILEKKKKRKCHILNKQKQYIYKGITFN